MNINWERLKIFQKVAEAGGITKAAQQENKTIAAMSRAITVFEDELQIKLFHRNNGIELTKEGKNLFRAASHISNIIKAEEDLLNGTISSLNGHIQVIASSGFSSMYISNFINEFFEENPAIDLEFIASNNLSIQEKLNGDILIHPYIDNLEGYVQERLITMNLKLYASESYIYKYGNPSCVTELDDHKLIAFSKNQKSYFNILNWHLQIGRKENDLRKPLLEVDETFGRCQLCAKGVGIITVPDQHPDVKKYNLIEILPDLRGPSVTYYLIIDDVLNKYKKIEVFSKFLQRKFL